MEFSASLKRAIKTGCVVLGPDRTEKCMNDGRALMIILAENCPAAFRTKIGGKKNPCVQRYEGSSAALGTACGKPFSVSTLAIINPGESNILSFKGVL